MEWWHHCALGANVLGMQPNEPNKLDELKKLNEGGGK